MQLWPWMKVKVVRLRKDYINLSLDYLHSKLDGDCLNSFWNNRTFIIFIIMIYVTLNEGQGQYNMWCILVSAAITMPRLTMTSSIASEESLARDIHTDTQTHTHTGSSTLNFFKVITRTLKTKRANTDQPILYYNMIWPDMTISVNMAKDDINVPIALSAFRDNQ